ncbi:MAG: DUF58 domain-containing protein [Pirellulales bacterium]
MPFDWFTNFRPSKPGVVRTTICHEGWYYLLVLAFVVTGSVLREINLLVVMAGMMLGPLLINWRHVVLGMRGVTARRKLPAALTAGELIEVRLHVRKAAEANRRKPRVTTALVLEDRIEKLDDDAEAAYPKALIWKLPPGEAHTSYRVRLAARGRYRFGPLVASTRFPIGLIRRSLGVDGTQEVVVFPRTGHLTPRWRQVLQTSFRGELLSQVRPGGAQGEFHRLREWRSGDSLRWIHWRTTARRGMPIVREFEMPGEPNYALLLDLVPSQEIAHIKSDVIERAVSFAATLISELCREGGSRWLTLACDTLAGQSQSGPTSRHLLREMLEALAAVQPHRDDRFPALLQDTLDRLQLDTQVILITARGANLAEQVAQLAAGGGPRQRRLAEGALIIDVTSAQFGELFRMHPPAKTAADVDVAEVAAP